MHRHHVAAHPGHEHGHDHGELADLLDLDARVLGRYVDELVEWLARLAPEPRTVVDLGAGTGVGALALARRFPTAEVVAVDRSPEMLGRVRATAGALADRMRTVQADLDDGWPGEVARADVVWASSSLHEVADPDRLLRDVHDALEPGGLLVVVEMDALPRFLPDDVAPGLEVRWHAALAEAGWNAHPDWRPHLQRAGFDVVGERQVPVEATADPATTARYARAWLRHVRRGLDGRPTGDERHVLDRLLAETGPDAVLDRGDLVVRGSRTAWAARRPVSIV